MNGYFGVYVIHYISISSWIQLRTLISYSFPVHFVWLYIASYVLNYDFSIHFITAPPVLLAASNTHISVPVNTDITLTIDVSAKPAPTAIWRLNSEDLPSMTTPSMK